MSGGTADFFVSHCASDAAWAEWIAWVLHKEGYRVILQKWDFRPSSNFVLDMHNATSVARRTVAVLSPDYLDAYFPSLEWTAALADSAPDRGPRLLPVMVRECDPRGLLRAIVQIRLVGLDEPRARRCLLDGVAPERMRPLTAPPFPARRRARSCPRPSINATVRRSRGSGGAGPTTAAQLR